MLHTSIPLSLHHTVWLCFEIWILRLMVWKLKCHRLNSCLALKRILTSHCCFAGVMCTKCGTWVSLLANKYASKKWKIGPRVIQVENETMLSVQKTSMAVRSCFAAELDCHVVTKRQLSLWCCLHCPDRWLWAPDDDWLAMWDGRSDGCDCRTRNRAASSKGPPASWYFPHTMSTASWSLITSLIPTTSSHITKNITSTLSNCYSPNAIASQDQERAFAARRQICFRQIWTVTANQSIQPQSAWYNKQFQYLAVTKSFIPWSPKLRDTANMPSTLSHTLHGRHMTMVILTNERTLKANNIPSTGYEPTSIFDALLLRFIFCSVVVCEASSMEATARGRHISMATVAGTKRLNEQQNGNSQNINMPEDFPRSHLSSGNRKASTARLSPTFATYNFLFTTSPFSPLSDFKIATTAVAPDVVIFNRRDCMSVIRNALDSLSRIHASSGILNSWATLLSKAFSKKSTIFRPPCPS